MNILNFGENLCQDDKEEDRCYHCKENNTGNRKTKVSRKCELCKKFICKEFTNSICKNCFEQDREFEHYF